MAKDSNNNNKLPIKHGFSALPNTKIENFSSDDGDAKGTPFNRGRFFKNKKIRKKKGGFKKFLIVSLGVISFLAILTVSSGVAFVAYVSQDLPNPDEVTNIDIRSSYIYDRDGNLLSEVFSEDIRRDPIDIENIPKHTKDAVVAIEDKRFYEHEGVDPIRIVGALISNVQTDSIQGGSTLTQQFMKNTLLSDEKDNRTGFEGYSRKVREIILAVQIERNFEKDEILEMYLNSIPWGDVAYGIGSASKLYFGKDVQELNIPESAMLAAMIQSPTYLSPYGNNIDQLISRRNTVIQMMFDQGYITEEEMEEGKKVPIIRPGEEPPATFVQTVFEPTRIAERKVDIKYPHFTYYVKEILADKFGEKQFAQGGYRVYTSISSDMQDKAEATLSDNRERINNYGANNGSIVAIDPKTGQILAMAGSIDYNDLSVNGNFNVATSVPGRQMGSSFKIYDYASAFERGYTPDTYVYDVETKFPGWPESSPPQNYSRTFRGPVKMKYALPASLNIPAIKAMYLGGINDTIKIAHEAGVESYDLETNRVGNPYGLAASLGSEEMPLMEHTAGYATFANNGIRKYMEIERDGEIRREPISVLRVEDADGNVVFDAEKDTKELRAVSEVTAKYTQTVLSERDWRPSWSRGFYPQTSSGTWEAMIKTGTTNDVKDSVMMGAVPPLAAGVWIGNTDSTELRQNATGSALAAPIWIDFMERALEGWDIESFVPTDQTLPTSCYIDKKPMAGGTILGGITRTKVIVNSQTGKLANEYTPEYLKETRIYYKPGSILDFVNYEQPCGEGSGDVNDNSDDVIKMAQIWRSGVEAWSKKNGNSIRNLISSENGIAVYFGDPPTEEDDYTEEVLPKVSISAEKSSITTNTKKLSVTVSGTAFFGVEEVAIDLDGNTLGTFNDFGTFSVNLPSDMVEKTALLTATLTDQNEQTAEDSFTLNITEAEEPEPEPEPEPITISESTGLSGTTLSSSDLPETITFVVKNADSVSLVVNGESVSLSKSGNKYSASLTAGVMETGNNSIKLSASNDSDEKSFTVKVKLKSGAPPEEVDPPPEEPEEPVEELDANP